MAVYDKVAGAPQLTLEEGRQSSLEQIAASSRRMCFPY
jgi:hypothetical protein